MEAAKMACFIVSDRDETAGANELATLVMSVSVSFVYVTGKQQNALVGTNVVGVESTKDDTEREEVVPLVEDGHCVGRVELV